MSASSRSTIFSLRSKKSKDSAELASATHAGPAYDDLPMSPRGPPITVSTIVPPSQQYNGSSSRHYADTSARLYYGDDMNDEGSDVHSVKSEPRNGYGTQNSLRGGSLGAGGGLSGPRPLPSRSGSAEKIGADGASKHNNPLGQTESPQVFYTPLVWDGSLTVETAQETRFFGSWIDAVSCEQCFGRFKPYGPDNFSAPDSRRFLKVVNPLRVGQPY